MPSSASVRLFGIHCVVPPAVSLFFLPCPVHCFMPDSGGDDGLEVGKTLAIVARPGIGASAFNNGKEHFGVELVFGSPSWSAPLLFFDATLDDGIYDGLLDGSRILVGKFGSQTLPRGVVPW